MLKAVKELNSSEAGSECCLQQSSYVDSCFPFLANFQFLVAAAAHFQQKSKAVSCLTPFLIPSLVERCMLESTLNLTGISEQVFCTLVA